MPSVGFHTLFRIFDPCSVTLVHSPNIGPAAAHHTNCAACAVPLFTIGLEPCLSPRCCRADVLGLMCARGIRPPAFIPSFIQPLRYKSPVQQPKISDTVSSFITEQFRQASFYFSVNLDLISNHSIQLFEFCRRSSRLLLLSKSLTSSLKSK
jgi:hypothetical protein